MISIAVCSLYLVKVFAGVEGLVALLLEIHGEGVGFLELLPDGAAAVAFQGVVPHQMVVRIAAREEAASAGAAEGGDCKLRDRGLNSCQSFLPPIPSGRHHFLPCGVVGTNLFPRPREETWQPTTPTTA